MEEAKQAVMEAQKRQNLKYFEHSSIYLMKCHEFYKIGIGGNPKKRLSQLQVGNPYKIELVAFSTVSLLRAERFEGFFHDLLSDNDLRVRGEWFKLSDKIVGLILNFFKKWDNHMKEHL